MTFLNKEILVAFIFSKLFKRPNGQMFGISLPSLKKGSSFWALSPTNYRITFSISLIINNMTRLRYTKDTL